MTAEKSLFWHQGLFLQPQHFQHYDRYVQSVVTPAYQYIQPYLWGVNNLEINESTLLNRVVEISALDAIFQDNTWAVLGKNCVIQPRSFEDLDFDFTGKEIFTVYLGLKRWDDFAANVTKVNSSDEYSSVSTRYLSNVNPVEVKDLYSENSPSAQLSFLEHNIKIFWPHEISNNDQYYFLPIAQLEMRGEEIYLNKSYIPPTFRMSGSTSLVQTVKHIREQTMARCRVLETYKPPQNQGVDKLELINLYYISALGYLNRYLAALTHLTETPAIHPWTIYGLLREMVAEISCFSDRVDGLGQLRDGTQLLPAYDHLDLERCFFEIQRLIVELLGSIVVGSENVIPMTREEFMFSCEIPDNFFNSRAMFCLMVRSDGMDQKAIESISRHAKVGNCYSIETLIARSLKGIPVEYREVPPLGMARHTDRTCFEIDASDHLWKDVSKDGKLCMFWEAAPEDTAIDLVITKL